MDIPVCLACVTASALGEGVVLAGEDPRSVEGQDSEKLGWVPVAGRG